MKKAEVRCCFGLGTTVTLELPDAQELPSEFSFLPTSKLHSWLEIQLATPLITLVPRGTWQRCATSCFGALRVYLASHGGLADLANLQPGTSIAGLGCTWRWGGTT